MSVTCMEENRCLTASLSGELDHHRAREVMEELDRQIDAALPRKLTLDVELLGTDAEGEDHPLDHIFTFQIALDPAKILISTQGTGLTGVALRDLLRREYRIEVEMALDRSLADNLHDWASVKARVREALSSYIYRRTKRSPMILPILLEV